MCIRRRTVSVYGQTSAGRTKRKPLEPMTPEREKAIMEGIEKNKHDFNIHGTIIRAKDRKTALKIYNNRKKK